MGNHQTSITAEFVSLIKSKNNLRYSLFVSNKAKRIFWVIRKIFFKEENCKDF